jgi:hypothetical protein
MKKEDREAIEKLNKIFKEKTFLHVTWEESTDTLYFYFTDDSFVTVACKWDNTLYWLVYIK